MPVWKPPPVTEFEPIEYVLEPRMKPLAWEEGGGGDRAPGADGHSQTGGGGYKKGRTGDRAVISADRPPPPRWTRVDISPRSVCGIRPGFG